MISAPRVQPVRSLDAETQLRIANELHWKIAGEVRFDAIAKALYATDASNYEIEPYGVVLPKSVDDVRRVLEVANFHGIPILPRGGGTSLAGQTVGAAIVLDFSKYLTEILHFDEQARTVKVQPGVVRDNLNQFLKPYNLQFTPDVATTSRANIGGMIGNNSSGTRSIKYGKTVDQVVSLTVMLSDGTVTELSELAPDALAAKLAAQGLEGEVYRTVHDVIERHGEEIEARYPKVLRRVGGYNLDEFTSGRPFNLAKLITGSEGTLALILDATLRLEPLPKHTCLALLHFETLEGALETVQFINQHQPSCVEILDQTLFDLGRKNPKLAPMLGWLRGRPAAVLMVEFDGDSEAEMLAKLEAMQDDGGVRARSYHVHVMKSLVQQREVWEFRKGSLGVFATMKGDAKPTPFIEDAAVPVEHLPKYIPGVIDICARHGVQTVMYAHASVGLLHVRPILNLKDEDDIAKYRSISEETFELVRRYGGSWSGEHGDGLARSYQNQAMFGPTLYDAFRTIKRTFDPLGLLNPGKIVDPPSMDENLRYGPDYRTEPLNTYFDFSEDGGYMRAIEMCSGVGHCRKTTTGTMCPSYMATRDEDHSTRGRANVLREALAGRMPGGMTSREVYQVLDLCLECKACKAECPSQVDLAKIKYEFLQHYHDAHGTPLGTRILGNVATAAPLARFIAPVLNRFLPLAPIRYLIEKTVGVDRRRKLPGYAHMSFARWHRQQRPDGTGDQQPQSAGPRDRRVALFADTWTMYHDTQVGAAAVSLLARLGYNVTLVPYSCCGRPKISKGLLRGAKQLAQQTVATLYPYVDAGIPVVGLEPSCVSALVDDYRDLIPGERTEAVAAHVKMIDQFLAREWTSGRLDPETSFSGSEERLMLHGHCQQRATFGTNASMALLKWIDGEAFEVDSGCCGMAGSFGYDHYDLSMKIGEDRLFPAVRQHSGAVVASGFSCRHQIADGTGRRAKHLVEVLAENVA